MSRWDKIAEELAARLEAANGRRPNAMTDAGDLSGPIIETTHRVIDRRTALPEPSDPGRFAENGRLLDSKKSFLSAGRKGKW